MTSDQLIAELRALPPDRRTADEFMQYLRLGLTFIEKHFYELQLADGTVIANGDITSAVAGIREIRDATLNLVPSTQVQDQARIRTRLRVTGRVDVSRYDSTCPRCGHIHEGTGECGVSMGKDRLCRCDLEVPA